MENPFETLNNRLLAIEKALVQIQAILTEKDREKCQQDIIFIDEACQLLGIAKSTMYGMISKRTVPSYRIGKKVYFKRSELIAHINSGRRRTVEEIRSSIK